MKFVFRFFEWNFTLLWLDFFFLKVLFTSCLYSSIGDIRYCIAKIKADVKSRVTAYPKQLVSLVVIGVGFRELNRHKKVFAQQKT